MAEDATKSTIYVDVEDDIATIIDKVEQAPQKVVALVLPKRSGALQSTVNMRLLKSSAEKASKKIALVTSESALLPLAGAVGLPVAKNLQSLPEVPAGPDLSSTGAEETAAATEVPPIDDDSAEAEQPYASARESRGKSEKSASKKEIPVRREASVGALADAHERKEPETVELGDEEEPTEDSSGPNKGKLAGVAAGVAAKGPKVKVPNFERFRRWFLLGGVGLIGLVAFLYLALAVLPKAKITVTTKATPVSLNLNLSASGGAKKLDETNEIIPSSVQTYKQTQTKTIAPTGKQDVGSKATGTVTMSQSTNCTTSPTNIPAGTTISSNSLDFTTENTASFPSTPSSFNNSTHECIFDSNSVNIIASAAGTDYNGATSFSVDGYSSTSASGSATSGGSSKIVTVVSQQDISKAVTALSDQTGQPSQDEVTKQFEQKLDGEGYYIVASTLKVSSPTPSSSPSVGQQASTATVTVTTTYSAMALKKADLTKLISDYAATQIDKSKQKIDTSDILSAVKIEVATQSSPTDASLTATGSVNAVPLLDEGSIRQSALGQKKGVLSAEISNWPGVEKVDIHLSPFWVSKVPSKPSKVTVTITADSSSN